MRYTHHRGLAAVTRWVRLKFAAMNLKKLAVLELEKLHLYFRFRLLFLQITKEPPAFVS